MQESKYFALDEQRGSGQSQVLFHAEAYSLMEAHRANLIGTGTSVTDVTLFVDRQTCGNCKAYMHKVMDQLGIDKLTMHSKYNETVEIIKIEEGKYERYINGILNNSDGRYTGIAKEFK